ncbi:hypothetical protein BGW39_001794, partial [Mortierella sp. 14UC]
SPESLVYSNLDIGNRLGVSVVEMDLLSSLGDEWGWGVLVLREEPLQHLKRPVLTGMRLGYRMDAIDWVFEKSPALEACDVPCFANASVGDAVSSLLQEWCPRVRHLSVQRPHLGYRGGGVMSVMEKIPEQRLESLYFQGYINEWPLQLELTLSRHTETLREIRFVLCRRANSSTLKTILTSCQALVYLEIQGTHLSTIHLSLEDAIESEWVCHNLEHLHIAVDMGQHEVSCFSSSFSSSQTRKAPGGSMVLKFTEDDQEADEDELVYWESVETFYRTIGSLTRLSILNLKLFSFDSHVKELEYTSTTIPALSTLGDGALHRPEAVTSMGQKEVEFMVEHWPHLELLEFLPTCHDKKISGLSKEEVILP